MDLLVFLLLVLLIFAVLGGGIALGAHGLLLIILVLAAVAFLGGGYRGRRW